MPELEVVFLACGEGDEGGFLGGVDVVILPPTEDFVVEDEDAIKLGGGGGEEEVHIRVGCAPELVGAGDGGGDVAAHTAGVLFAMGEGLGGGDGIDVSGVAKEGSFVTGGGEVITGEVIPDFIDKDARDAVAQAGVRIGSEFGDVVDTVLIVVGKGISGVSRIEACGKLGGIGHEVIVLVIGNGGIVAIHNGGWNGAA